MGLLKRCSSAVEPLAGATSPFAFSCRATGGLCRWKTLIPIQNSFSSIFQSLLPTCHFQLLRKHADNIRQQCCDHETRVLGIQNSYGGCMPFFLQVFTEKVATWLAEALDTRMYEKVISRVSPKVIQMLSAWQDRLFLSI